MIFSKIKKSFKYAWAGFNFFLKERNIKIHLFVTILVVISGIVFNISSFEWVAIIICIFLVLSFEILNTVIEDLVDFLHPKKDQRVMVIKDLAAAAVFVPAIGSVIVGLFIFVPYFFERLQ